MSDVKSKTDVDVHQLVVEKTASDDSPVYEQAHIDMFTPAEQKRIIRRIDWRLVPTLGLMNAASLMDRTNLGIAVVGGMGVDLNLIGFRYSTITLVFFATYCLLQPLVTVALRKVGPRIFLPTVVLSWGATMICFGFVTDYRQMVALRLVLGVFEAGYFPGCVYLLSCWYPRYDLQKRNAVFYVFSSLASAFAGVIAFGFYNMNTLGNLGPTYGQHYGPTETDPTAKSGIMPGIAGWRWIFIMQGLLTVLIAFGGSLMIADFPEKAASKSSSCAIPFLSHREAEFVVARIEKDRSDAIPTSFNLREYIKCAADVKIWGFAAIFMFTTTCTYAIAFFLPIILQSGMGFGIGAAQCLVGPPYALAAIWMYICAVLGDKYHLRGPFILFNACLGLIGLGLLGFAKASAVRYFGVFLVITSANTNIPCILTFQANNVRGQWKRAFCSATLVGAGGIGGIIGSTVFRSQDKPTYRPGMYACLMANGGVIVITLLLDLKLWLANKRAAKGGKIIEGLDGFRYTL